MANRDQLPVTDSVLRILRERSGMTIGALERATGINRGRLSIIERGVAPTKVEVDAILDAIDDAKWRPRAMPE